MRKKEGSISQLYSSGEVTMEHQNKTWQQKLEKETKQAGMFLDIARVVHREAVDELIAEAATEERERLRKLVPHYATGECEPWASENERKQQESYAAGVNDTRNQFIDALSVVHEPGK